MEELAKGQRHMYSVGLACCTMTIIMHTVVCTCSYLSWSTGHRCIGQTTTPQLLPVSFEYTCRHNLFTQPTELT